MIVDFYIPCLKVIEESSVNKSHFLADDSGRDLTEEYIQKYEYRARHNTLYDMPIGEDELFSGRRALNNQMVYDNADYDYFKATALLVNMQKKAMNEEEFNKLVENGDSRLLIINIDPNSFEGDAETEFNRWFYESRQILADEMLDNETRINYLPVLDFRIGVEGKVLLNLKGCKCVKNYSDNKFPFFFAILIKEIIKTNE